MLTTEESITHGDDGRVHHWWRWSCSCGGTGSWLHDKSKVERMAAAHAVKHMVEEVRCD